MFLRKSPACFAGAVVALALTSPAVLAGSGEVTLIHIGDIHGHMVPRPNVRSDGNGQLEGGLARMYTVIKNIRKDNSGGTLLINTGDTLQGSGEALFSRGQAMVDVLNLFKIDAYTPGNWDFLYGAARFEELFKGTASTPPKAPWNALASNLYYNNQFDDAALCGRTGTDPATGTVRPLKRVVPAYWIKQVGDLKVGILGFTTARAIAAVGTTVTKNYQFHDGSVELPCFINVLRTQENVDVLVMISEMEMSRDIALIEKTPGVNVVLNSDMHEQVIKPIVVNHADGTQTVIVEEGQDGTMVGEFELEVEDGIVTEWEWTAHRIRGSIKPNSTIAAKVKEVRKPYVKGTFVAGQKVVVGGNTTILRRPIDEIVAYTQMDLHRSNFMNEALPGVVEGSSHNLIADAMRWAAGADTGAIRGFRYGTHIPAGWPITMQDIFHYIPIAAKLGRSPKACGADLKFQIEQSTAGTFHPDPTLWAGGWMFGYSNVSFDLDACDGLTTTPVTPIGVAGAWKTFRGTNIKVGGAPMDINDVYDTATKSCKSGHPGYAVAGYWFADDPTTINNCNPCRGRQIQVVDNNLNVINLVPGQPLPNSEDMLDVTEAVVKYLKTGLNGVVTTNNLTLNRIKVKRLPTINPFPFNVVQPLKGSTAATCPVL